MTSVSQTGSAVECTSERNAKEQSGAQDGSMTGLSVSRVPLPDSRATGGAFYAAALAGCLSACNREAGSGASQSEDEGDDD